MSQPFPSPDILRRALVIKSRLPEWLLPGPMSLPRRMAESAKTAKLCISLAEAQRDFEAGVAKQAAASRCRSRG